MHGHAATWPDRRSRVEWAGRCKLSGYTPIASATRSQE